MFPTARVWIWDGAIPLIGARRKEQTTHPNQVPTSPPPPLTCPRTHLIWIHFPRGPQIQNHPRQEFIIPSPFLSIIKNRSLHVYNMRKILSLCIYLGGSRVRVNLAVVVHIILVIFFPFLLFWILKLHTRVWVRVNAHSENLPFRYFGLFSIYL